MSNQTETRLPAANQAEACGENKATVAVNRNELWVGRDSNGCLSLFLGKPVWRGAYFWHDRNGGGICGELGNGDGTSRLFPDLDVGECRMLVLANE